MVRKIVDRVTDQRLMNDLESYQLRAVKELGATDAKIIAAEAVLIDERVRAKCAYPKCMFYGSSAHCPPHVMSLDETRKVVDRFRYGIFTRLQVPIEEFSGPAVMRGSTARGLMKTHQIVSGLESLAFYDGYYLALGFACGPCKHLFCRTEDCSALTSGHTCRHPSMARLSMEAAGMDVFRMAARVGWDVFPIGASVPPAEVPCAASYGLVLVD